MKLKSVLSSVALVVCSLLFAAPATPPLGGFLTPEPTGGFRVGDIQFRLAHFGKDWRLALQGEKTIKAAAGFPAASPGRFEFKGEFNVAGGAFDLAETITSAAERRARLQLNLNSTAPIVTNDLALETLLPCDHFLERPILADGKELNFKESIDPKYKATVRRIRKLQLTLDRGILTITGNFQIQFQDNRIYKLQEWSLRIQPDRSKLEVSTAALDLELNYEPFKNVPLDIREAANVAFADEAEGDGKGGWTDQGPANDLRTFPVAPAEYAGIPFAVIDPAANANRAVIALRGKNRPAYPATATVELKEPVAAQSLYLLHAIAWEPGRKVRIGTVRCEYADSRYTEKEEQLFPVVSGVNVANFWMPRGIEDAAIGWQHRNESSGIGLYVTRFKLSGKPVKRIVLESTGEAEWLIPAMTLSDRKVNFAKELPVVMQANQDWLPLVNRKDVKPGSVLDFSDLLDAPAGKYGFARNVNGRIEFEKRPGVPARFYGANICFMANFMEKELTDKMIEGCARLGYNIVRMHHYDAFLAEKNSTALNPERLDRFDYLLSELKKRGIYVTIDLFSLRKFSKGAFPECPDWAPGEHDFKMLVFLSDSAMRNYREFAANLLNHVNPYTGLAWKEDPAIVSMCMLNEDTIFSNLLAPRSSMLVQKRFEEWLSERRLAPNKQELERYRKIFLMELYRKGYRQLEEFYRKLGVRSMTTDQNMWANPATSLLREPYNLVDNHFYWAHPQFVSGWGLPAIVNAESSIPDGAGSLSVLFCSRLYGKPFSVTEWDYVNPNPFAVEGAFLAGSYAALQDWSILCRFAYCDYPAEPAVATDRHPTTFFTVINDPLRRLSELAGAVTFLRGDVKTSEVNFPFLLSRNHFERLSEDTYPTLIRRLGLIGKTGTLLADSGTKPELPAGTRAAMAFRGEWQASDFSVPLITGGDTEARLAELRKLGAITANECDASGNRFASSTGELLLDRAKGTFQAVTPRSESFLLGPDLSLAGTFAAVRNRLCFGAFLIASRDGLPLAESRRILLLHLTSTRNTEQRFRNSACNIVEDWGKSPLLIRRGEADVTLNRDLSGFKLYGVGLDGTRGFQVPVEIRDGKSFFQLKTAAPTGVCAAYELVAE